MENVPDKWKSLTEKIVNLLMTEQCGPLDSFGVIFFVLAYMAEKHADERGTPELPNPAVQIALIQGNAMVSMNPRLLAAMATGAVSKMADGYRHVHGKEGNA